MPIYEQRLEALFSATHNTLTTLGIQIQFTDIANSINPHSVATAVGRIANEIGALVANAFLIFLMVIFMLFEVSTLPEKLEKIMKRPVDSIGKLSQFKQNLQRYLVIKSVASLATALLIWILLSIIGVDFAILWALLAFFLNFVPNNRLDHCGCSGRPDHLAAAQYRVSTVGRDRLCGHQLPDRVGHRTARRRAAFGSFAPDRISVVGVLGLGTRTRRHVSLGPPDHDGETGRGEQRKYEMAGRCAQRPRFRPAPTIHSTCRQHLLQSA